MQYTDRLPVLFRRSHGAGEFEETGTGTGPAASLGRKASLTQVQHSIFCLPAREEEEGHV